MKRAPNLLYPLSVALVAACAPPHARQAIPSTVPDTAAPGDHTPAPAPPAPIATVDAVVTDGPTVRDAAGEASLPRDGAAEASAPAGPATDLFVTKRGELIKAGFAKLDTPSWRPAEGFLVFKDTPASGDVLYKMTPTRQISVLLPGGGRSTTAASPDHALYLWTAQGLARLDGTKAEVLATKFSDGTSLSVNDLVVSSRKILYFTSLKWPDGQTGVGRMSMMRIEEGKIDLVWDARQKPAFENPNGVALSPKEDVLYVGVAVYRSRSMSGIYRFPILADGSVDVAAGRRFGTVSAPDGLATDVLGDVYAVSGSTVHALSREGKTLGTASIGSGSASNLGFGGADMKTLYVTTNTAIYELKTGVAGTLP